jgi:hypothetical protein
VIVKIVPSETPAGKLAEAELHFEDGDGVLAGFKLIGFSVWERIGGSRNVTFPARSYAVNGERRSFALLRPATDGVGGQERLRDLVLEAYAESVAAAAPVVPAAGRRRRSAR